MADDPRLTMWLDQWEQDQAEGKTVRALHRRIDDHDSKDDLRFTSIERRFEKLRGSVDRARGREEAREEGTGRYAVVSGDPRNPHTPLTPIVPLLLQPPERHSSIFPAIKKAMAAPIAKWIAIAITSAAGGFLTRHVAGMGSEQVKEQPRVIYVPVGPAASVPPTAPAQAMPQVEVRGERRQ